MKHSSLASMLNYRQVTSLCYKHEWSTPYDVNLQTACSYRVLEY